MADNEVAIDTERGMIYVDKTKFDQFHIEIRDIVKGCISCDGEFYYEDYDNLKEDLIEMLNKLLT